MTVQPDYLQAAFAEIRSRHASVDAYLDQVVGLTPRRRDDITERLVA